MHTVTATQLASEVAFHARLTELQASAAIKAIGEAVVRQVQAGRVVQLDGFGVFDKGLRADGTPALRFAQAKKVREALA